MARDAEKAGLQSIKITFEFTNHDAPEGTEEVTTLDVTDTPEVIAVIQAVAVYPALTMMTERFQEMINMKLMAQNPDLALALGEMGNK